MAKYTINYACGHGSHVEQLYGKTSERERRIAWEEANTVCPECWKAQCAAADEATPMTATISVVCNGAAVSLRVEVRGKTQANKEALSALGIRNKTAHGGFMDMFSMKQKWFCGNEVAVKTPEELLDKGYELSDALAKLGYAVHADFDPTSVDFALAMEMFAKKEADRLAQKERELADPRPAVSPLRARISQLEKETHSTWNGKIYGKPGSWNFYVANVRHTATDEEVREREKNVKLHAAWRDRQPTAK